MPKEQKSHEPVESTGFEKGPGNQQEKGYKIYLSHDGLFKFSFDKKNVVESFVKENLPEEITRELDFSTLTLDKDTFVDQKLSRCYSDILYHIRFKDNPAYLYFLFEHKSWEPDFPGVQLLKNMTRIWEKHLEKYKKTKKLPPIIPLLVYHGEHPWKADTRFISMFDIPVALEKYIPAFNFELYDVSHLPEEQIKGDVELRITLMAFRYIFHPDILSRLKDIFKLFRELPDKSKFNQYLEALLIYLGSNIKNVKPGQLRDAINEVLEEGGAIMSTVFQEVLKEGKEIGVKEGKEIGVKEGKEIGMKEGRKDGAESKAKEMAKMLKENGVDIDLIAKSSGLSREEIEKL
jgi:predicted transposase/invertase (TIGR01784 family)